MKNICVFLGSHEGKNPEYVTCARQLGAELAGRGIGVVYGGCGTGLMGALADGALEKGGRVTGVIPEQIAGREIAHKGLSEVLTVKSMRERKALMEELSDGFIALPGGIGTLEELFEMLTGAQLGFHKKPVGVLNASGYFDPLLQFLRQAVDSGFYQPVHNDLLLVESSAQSLLSRFAGYIPPENGKWLRRS